MKTYRYIKSNAFTSGSSLGNPAACLFTDDAPLSDEVSIFPNEVALRHFCMSNNIDIILIFCLEVENKTNFAHTRVFAPKFGYLEDPATGSGNSAFANYLLSQGMWQGEPISIEQGGCDRTYNCVRLKRHESKVLFGGKATTIIEGVYHV